MGSLGPVQGAAVNKGGQEQAHAVFVLKPFLETARSSATLGSI